MPLMTANRRLHSVLLTLWDIARDNPNYDRKLWGELQFCLTNLETRNNLLCAVLGDLLHCTDDEGNVMWEKATIHSPPQGYAIKFMREELRRGGRPQIPKPTPVVTDDYDPVDDLSLVGPPPITHRTDAKATSAAAEKTPIGVGGEYDGEDESDEEDHLAFEFDLAESDDTTD